MNRFRTIAPTILLAASLAALAQDAATAEDANGVAIKIQIGGHLLTQETGIGSSWLPDSSEDDGGVVAALTFLGKDGGRHPYGICMELDGNRVKVGPAIGLAGSQIFGIATIRIMGQMEYRLRKPRTEPPERFQPYVSVGVGWNFHSTGAKIEWIGLPPPAGTPLALDLEGSPAVRLGMGFHRRATEAGLSINLEGGWKWDAGNFRMRVQDEPDRRADYDLSGAFLLFGITLRF